MTSPPAWPPQTEEQLRAAAVNGILVESHTLDLKQELKGGDSANGSIAKDIAAFSQDGGVILIGVAEVEGKPPTLAPVELAGLSERIEQLALTRVDEPVKLTTREIPSDTESGRGYLVVEIPASPRPPHMADGKYYGRGDKTNRVLPNAEVIRLHERLIQQNKDILLEALVMLNDLGDSKNVMAILAKPLGAPEEMLLPLLASGSRRNLLFEMLVKAGIPDHQNFIPSLRNPFGLLARPGGIAATTWHGNARFEGTENQAEVKLHESGTITLLSGRATGMYKAWGEVLPRVMESIIVGHTDLVVRLAAEVAAYSGFSGSWRFGLVVSGLDGANSFALAEDRVWDEQIPLYTEQTYKRATTASLNELRESPEIVARNLVGQLLRSLQSAHKFRWLQSSD